MGGCQVRIVDDQKICFFQYLFDWPSLMKLHIIHQGVSVSSVSNRLLNQEMSIGKGIWPRFDLDSGEQSLPFGLLF